MRLVDMLYTLSAMGIIGCFAVMNACKDPATTAAAVDAGKYAADLEICLQRSDDCQTWVDCSHSVQRKWNQPESGSCVLADAGKDAD